VNKIKKGIKWTKIDSVILNDHAYDETIEHLNAVNLDDTKPSEPITTNNDIDGEGDDEKNIVKDEEMDAGGEENAYPSPDADSEMHTIGILKDGFREKADKDFRLDKEDILSRIDDHAKKDYREVGFTKRKRFGLWFPIIQLSPFDTLNGVR